MNDQPHPPQPPKQSDLDVLLGGIVTSLLTVIAGPALALYFGLTVDVAFFQTPLVVVSLLWVVVSQVMSSRASKRDIYEARTSTQAQINAYQAASTNHIHEVRTSTNNEIDALRENIGRVVTALGGNLAALADVNKNLVRVSSDMGVVAEDVRKREASLPQLEVTFGGGESETREVVLRLDKGDEKKMCSTTYLAVGEETTVAISIKNLGGVLAIHPRLSLSVPGAIEVKGGPLVRITPRPTATAVLIEGEPILGGGNFAVQYSLSFRLLANLAPGTFVPIEYLLQAESIPLKKDYLAVGVKGPP